MVNVTTTVVGGVEPLDTENETGDASCRDRGACLAGIRTAPRRPPWPSCGYRMHQSPLRLLHSCMANSASRCPGRRERSNSHGHLRLGCLLAVHVRVLALSQGVLSCSALSKAWPSRCAPARSRLTLPSSGRLPACFARFQPPLMSNVGRHFAFYPLSSC